MTLANGTFLRDAGHLYMYIIATCTIPKNNIWVQYKKAE